MKNRSLFIAIGLALVIKSAVAFQARPAQKTEPHPYAKLPDIMPGTKSLSPEEDRSIKILEGAHTFIEEKIKAAPANRSVHWSRDFSSPEAYERSIDPNRKRFMNIIGVSDKSNPPRSFKLVLKEENPSVIMEKIAVNNDPIVISETSVYRVYQVRWPVLHNVNGEGLLLEPKTKSIGSVIAIPDADQTPEQLAGMAEGIPAESQFARRLAENGYQVLIPVVISRDLLMPGSSELLRQTNREWIYRQAFHMGRHIIGYEVQKILSAIDWFKQSDPLVKVGIAGYHEGGLLAFYAAAVDKRIEAALVSGYFKSRQKVWDEPIFRNVWNLLTEFGDAEIASLIAPRTLILEHSAVPEWIDQAIKPGGSAIMVGKWSLTGYKGSLRTPGWETVQEEYERIGDLTKPGFQKVELVSDQNHEPLPFGSQRALESFSSALGGKGTLPLGKEIPSDNRRTFHAKDRQLRQVRELEDHVQWLMRDSDYRRNSFYLYKVMPEFEKRSWSTKPYHPSHAPDRFIEQSKEFRKIFYEEIIGRFDDPMLPPDPRSRKLYDNDKWTGYEVQMDVYPNLKAAGVILIPKDLKQGERRPVVVCQHGRDGYPQRMINEEYTAYNNTAAKLADRGFIVYAPYNPYRGEDKYRWLVRKATSVGKSMYSFIIAQHDQTLRWLGSLPFVDQERIGFYGLSFGGETAMRVPSVLEGYCLSICSGDFGDYTRKVVDTHFSRGFMNSMEWEIPVFNLGNTFSHAEMAYLIFPRPFMVERGHDDLVQQSDWVSYEFGKVRYLYDQFGLGTRTTIEFFNGGHSMRGEGTFDFLHTHLKWPNK